MRWRAVVPNGRTPSLQKEKDLTRIRIEISGIVQGVGFRPFIHRLVNEYRLCGYIRNSTSGVEMELEGDEEALKAFTADIRRKSPKLALIETLRVIPQAACIGYEGFQIVESTTETHKRVLISPDVCTCEDCLRELFDSGDRRYRFPFINCTNCGPRFTIIADVPYDRDKTTMWKFPMCAACEAEYRDITDRRYHAQPDCCPACGPRLFYLHEAGQETAGDPIEAARQSLLAQKIVAIKGLGGMHLACLPAEPETLLKLRSRKQRDEKPFALMCRDLEAARKLCFVSDAEAAWLKSEKRPIVLLKKREPGLEHISENGYIGVMLPYTPVHFLLMEQEIDTLVMTSANLSDLPILYRNEEALEKLSGIADGFLLNDRDIHVRCDDSLLWVFRDKPYPVRRSRGFVPYPIGMDRPLAKILACGAEQKASFALSKGNHVFPSQHIGDLKNLETLDNYEGQINHFERLFDIRPQRIVCDLHPDYMSTAYAEVRAAREGLPLIRVQHHFAHMAACMADNGLDTPCIGLIWDGTGYGADGSAWGGEFLTGDYHNFIRRGSILPMALPGGDRAVKDIWRLGCTLLDMAGKRDLPLFPNAETSHVYAMLDNRLNCPKTSSIGRLFDGVCAILGIKEKVSYEGQGAILLEQAAAAGETAHYSLAFMEAEGVLCFDYRPMLRELIRDREAQLTVGIIAARFMNTLIAMAVALTGRIGADSGLGNVVLSGGVMQNMYLLAGLTTALESAGFTVYTHSRVSCNDEGISLGQLMIAQNQGDENENVPGGTAQDHGA